MTNSHTLEERLASKMPHLEAIEQGLVSDDALLSGGTTNVHDAAATGHQRQQGLAHGLGADKIDV